MGQRGPQDWSKERLKVGTIRIRRHSKNCRVRMIKVRDDGPKGRRWISLARHWWLTHHGPIPPGKRVIHADGDVLNDDPENYALATADDVLVLSRDWDPTLDRRNRLACRRGTAKHNREAARLRQALQYMPTYWYAVDPERWIVLNRPFRSRVGLFRFFLGPEVRSRNGKEPVSAWLGWPGLPVLDGQILHVLQGKSGCELSEIVAEVAAARTVHGLGPAPLRLTFTTRICALRRRGFVRSLRIPGRLARVYYATPAGLAEGNGSPGLVAVRGHEVEARFPGFKKLFIEQWRRRAVTTKAPNDERPERKETDDHGDSE